MQLKTIKNSNAKGYLVLGVSEDGALERYTVSEAQYSRMGSPLIGDELSEEAFRMLTGFAEYNRAKIKALNILSFGDNSRFYLVGKLVRSGISVAVAKDVTDEMLRLGYINEERQLERLISIEVKRKTGPKKFIPKLRAKGYSSSDISKVLNKLISEGKINLEKTKKEILASLPEGCTYEEKTKILFKHGF